jgi:hypothetical protein
MPSFNNSPWKRGASQRGISRLIRWTRLRTSLETEGRPARRRDFRRQNKRKPCRCQRSNVSGLKMSDEWSSEGNSQ